MTNNEICTVHVTIMRFIVTVTLNGKKRNYNLGWMFRVPVKITFRRSRLVEYRKEPAPAKMP